MGFFNKMAEPVFLKEDSTAKSDLEALKTLRDTLNPEGQKLIDADIRCLEYGITGEENIAFELRNSHIPMYIMHDIYIEHNGLEAQIDYIIVTRKIIFVIECKNLYGNIEINSNGDFIRTMYYGNKPVKEGIYSPITQNSRHLELLKSIKTEQKNMIVAMAFKRSFYDNYKSIVVLANPKTILNCRYAKKEIKEQVIRADQLIRYIKNECNKSKNPECSDKNMQDIAMGILKLRREKTKDYTKKYEKYIVAPEEPKLEPKPAKEESNLSLYDRLKDYRLNKSREENIKPYYLFNNKQLDELVARKPMTKGELVQISGFGEVKAEKYGPDIINVIKKYSNTINIT